MKRLITASDRYTPNGGYLYIFKHGIGPGTIPSDVSVVKTKDLPNYYTAVWLDRFLTADELKKYDIPSETEINRYLDRIGYCQKNGDVVPCDGVEACGKVTASTNPDFVDEKVKFFYKHEFLGACDPEYMECDKLYELIKSDSRAATQVLHYMNSLGDPVFPTKEGGYEPETDVSKVNIDDLYYWFMRELEYQYQDDMSMGFGFLVDADFQPWDFEIFDGPVAEDNVIV